MSTYTHPKRLAALVVAAFFAIGILAVPAAEAQNYTGGGVAGGSTGLSQAEVCASSASDATLSGSGTSYVVTLPPNAAECASNALVEFSSVRTTVYDGPAVNSLAIPVELGTCGKHTIFLTMTLKAGGTKVQTWNPNSDAPGCTPTATSAGVPPVPAAVAFTGSDVSVPAALGFSLIGAGGLVLLAARKRQS